MRNDQNPLKFVYFFLKTRHTNEWRKYSVWQMCIAPLPSCLKSKRFYLFVCFFVFFTFIFQLNGCPNILMFFSTFEQLPFDKIQLNNLMIVAAHKYYVNTRRIHWRNERAHRKNITKGTKPYEFGRQSGTIDPLNVFESIAEIVLWFESKVNRASNSIDNLWITQFIYPLRVNMRID